LHEPQHPLLALGGDAQRDHHLILRERLAIEQQDEPSPIIMAARVELLQGRGAGLNEPTRHARFREPERGGPHGLLVVLDGAKGLRAAVRDVFGDDAVVQRCQWHTRENVLRYLTKPQQVIWRRKLRAAYAHGGYADAKRALQRLIRELAVLNESAARSLEEGLEETLTRHRLNLPDALRRSLNTTNVIESVMAQIERKTQRVDHWRTSDQKQRWCAATLLHIVQNVRRIRGMADLPLLQSALQQQVGQTTSAA
jgi:hypothetical protein